ncbi:30S ribosomal protein S8 [Candidatus Hodgkinia cicadicola]
MSTGPIAGMISHLNNCISKKKPLVLVPYSKHKFNVLKAIKLSGYVDRLSVLRYSSYKADIVVEFRCVCGAPLVRSIVQVSKPGSRVYWTRARASKEFGVLILSTNTGVVNSTSLGANGGEVVCKLI